MSIFKRAVKAVLPGRWRQRRRRRLLGESLAEQSELRNGDLNKPIDIANTSLVLMNWTMQFVRPLKRGQLMEETFNGLTHGPPPAG